MTSDVQENCSVCLKTGTVFNIFTTYNISNDKEELYVELIKKWYNIEITQDSGFDTLCADCIMKLGTNDFRNDILEAAQRLVASQDINESQEKYDDRFEDDYDLNTILNPETGQISYTLDKINKITTENEADSYLIDLENDVIPSKAPKKLMKKRKINADIVKENIPGNIESVINVEQKKRVKRGVKKKETVKVFDENIPGIVESKGNNSEKPKGEAKNNVTEKSEYVTVEIGENRTMKLKPIRPSKANQPPSFTLEPGQLDCKECGQRFDTTKTLSTHMNTHYPDYVCAVCGQVFASQRRLRVHKTQAHVEGPLTCKYCDKEFTNVNTRNAHMWRVHTKTDPFKCSQCDERFKTYLKRLRHVKEAHGNAAEYPCQYCDKKFAYAAYRTKHVRTKHLGVRNYKCTSCPFSFARRRELDAHRASKHGDGELKYQCDICSRRFFLKTALKYHVNLHVNRYSCNQCDAKFPKIHQLETHRKVHELEPPLTPLLDPGSLHLDPGPLSLDPGILQLDPGSLHLDPGILPLDPESLQLDSGSLHLDSESLHLDPGPLQLDDFADYSLTDSDYGLGSIYFL